MHQIDHKNGIRHDNRLCNLREATRFQNQQNLGISIRNTSGFMGVSYHKVTAQWRASIRTDHGHKHLGYFDTPEAAAAAYRAAANRNRGEFSQFKREEWA